MTKRYTISSYIFVWLLDWVYKFAQKITQNTENKLSMRIISSNQHLELFLELLIKIININKLTINVSPLYFQRILTTDIVVKYMKRRVMISFLILLLAFWNQSFGFYLILWNISNLLDSFEFFKILLESLGIFWILLESLWFYY